MKKCFFAALALVAALGCKNTFDLTDDWKDIPVVYGFLNQKDTAHYVRVEKAFLDPQTSALTIAKVADSLYYTDAAVFLEKANGTRFQLQRVDGDLEGYPREAGVFAQSPNILYKVKQDVIKLQPGELCKFVLERGDNLPPVTSQTTILGQMELLTPAQSVNGIQFKTGDDFTFRWSAPEEAQIFDISGVVRVREDRGGAITIKTIPWDIFQGTKRLPGAAYVTQKVPGAAFYKLLADNLQPEAGVNRYITSTGIDFRIDGGGSEINEYNDVINANAGISGAELIPIYTNMSEGFGLFTSRGYTVQTGFGPNPLTRDSLQYGQFTKNLGFK